MITKKIFWYQQIEFLIWDNKVDFFYTKKFISDIKNHILISRNQFFISKNHFLISNKNKEFFISKNWFPDIKKFKFLISIKNLFFWYQEIDFCYQKIIFDITNSNSLYQEWHFDIKKWLYFLISEYRFFDIRK